MYRNFFNKKWQFSNFRNPNSRLGMHCDSYSSQLLRKFNTLPAAAAVYATLEIKELRLACVNMTPGIGTLAF